ncbi:uncharacterized protein BKCO1_3300088 [Diplodia corticola]|uniref:Transmembrane protein n=1 Tax=Diplodia corticola TaxID=236234 RepID=A0A1J9QXQ1_9PEZI|nr:uncharacterized protein BKCO1_3300088 [Diplodia corticola]OJD33153.1 transmembrane protein [Diplodia corticola]
MAEASQTDIKIACVAAGFTIGFGYLTAWDAWKVTSSMRNPLRNLFVWMVWSELVVNAAMGIIAWLFLLGYIKSAFGTYFSIVILWVIEIQFILQIIINRIAIITTDKSLLRKIRITTICFITLINISVFCIFIPGHLGVNDTFVRINNIWDKITKVLIGANDAVLNWFFIVQVKKRLVANGLQKYNRLAAFNTRIALISVGMDFLIIGTMFLKNGAVFLQFHPVAYIVKLKIELSMANLIRHIAQEAVHDIGGGSGSGSDGNKNNNSHHHSSLVRDRREFGVPGQTRHSDVPMKSGSHDHALRELGRITQKREYTVEVERAPATGPGSGPRGHGRGGCGGEGTGRSSSASTNDYGPTKCDGASDETPLHW